jgi:hypothetical protein
MNVHPASVVWTTEVKRRAMKNELSNLLRLCGESLALLFGHFLFGAKGVRESMT